MSHACINLTKNPVRPLKFRQSCSHVLKIPAKICMFKVDNRNTRKKSEICSELTIKTPKRSVVFIFNFEHILHLFLEFLLSTVNWCFLGYHLICQLRYIPRKMSAPSEVTRSSSLRLLNRPHKIKFI